MIGGQTAAGTVPHRGIVAADPAVLPLGTFIRITGAGPYNGIYLVTDTGDKIAGRHIDLYVPTAAEARHCAAVRFSRLERELPEPVAYVAESSGEVCGTYRNGTISSRLKTYASVRQVRHRTLVRLVP